MTNHTSDFPMISGDSNLMLSIPIAISMDMSEHTHTHICTCLHNMFTPEHKTLKNEILSSPMEVGIGKHKINSQSRKIYGGKKMIFPASTTQLTRSV